MMEVYLGCLAHTDIRQGNATARQVKPTAVAASPGRPRTAHGYGPDSQDFPPVLELPNPNSRLETFCQHRHLSIRRPLDRRPTSIECRTSVSSSRAPQVEEQNLKRKLLVQSGHSCRSSFNSFMAL